MAKKMTPLKTPEICAALRKRHDGAEWIYFEQVRGRVGFSSRTRQIRTADAVAFNVWESRGLELHGFEVKQDRADVLRELKDPGKSEQVQQYCDRWWLAVGSAGLIKDDELPPTWGLLVPRGKGLIVKVQAPKLPAKPWTREFIAAMWRKFQAAKPRDDVVAVQINAARSEGYEDGKDTSAHLVERHKKIADRHERDLRGVQRREREFQEAAGFSWSYRDGDLASIGAAYGALKDRANVEKKLGTARAALDAFQKLVDALENLQEAEA